MPSRRTTRKDEIQNTFAALAGKDMSTIHMSFASDGTKYTIEIPIEAIDKTNNACTIGSLEMIQDFEKDEKIQDLIYPWGDLSVMNVPSGNLDAIRQEAAEQGLACKGISIDTTNSNKDSAYILVRQENSGIMERMISSRVERKNNRQEEKADQDNKQENVSSVLYAKPIFGTDPIGRRQSIKRRLRDYQQRQQMMRERREEIKAERQTEERQAEAKAQTVPTAVHAVKTVQRIRKVKEVNEKKIEQSQPIQTSRVEMRPKGATIAMRTVKQKEVNERSNI